MNQDEALLLVREQVSILSYINSIWINVPYRIPSYFVYFGWESCKT